MTMNCANWTTNSTTESAWAGGANITNQYWWHDLGPGCSAAAMLYCFEK
jgi:hypothetical protein